MSTHDVFAARRAQDRGDLVTAKSLYRRVLDDRPASLGAAAPLAAILESEGKHAEAFAILRPFLARSPQSYELLVQAGRCLLHAGQAASAIPLLEAAVAQSPRLPDARLWLAESLLALHRPDKATAAVAAIADDHRARTLMGRALMAVGRATEAIDHLRAAVAMHPGAAQNSQLGWALESRGELHESLTHFDAAIAADPAYLSALAGRASALKSLGRHDEALALVEPLLDRANADVALVYARLAATAQERTRAVAVLDRVLANPTNEGIPYATLQCAKGALLEHLGDYDSAFGSFRAANESAPPTFDRVSYDRSMREILDAYPGGASSHHVRASNADQRPVFIVGMPRSGTSLVEQILASHPAVFGAGELDDLTRLVRAIPELLATKQPFPACIASLTTEQLDRLAARYLDRVGALAPSAQRITDKMPQNFMFLGFVEQVFPGARVIHCLRDPVDTCLSCYTTPLSGGHSYRRRMTDLAAAYRSYRNAMDHWRATLRIPMLEVKYEDLVAEPEPNIRRLVEFVGLPWDDRCLQPHENPRHVSTASIDQVRRPINRASVQRWRRYERHLGPLINDLNPWLE